MAVHLSLCIVEPAVRRLNLFAAVPEYLAANLVAEREYYAFQVNIRHAKTVGTGNCAGCCTPVTLLFNSAV